ncbi:MAG TPA: competence/damage-inducible protein A [Vicinamibacterales bacterium]|nr:competence/damage-inducible protein A [Vicinamibacterales bacterium]
MGNIRTAEIVAVGSELLTAHRLDTNSLFLTGRLNELGIDVRAKAVVGDDRADLAAILRDALGRADLVITTGGLGPTEDDLTREVVAEVLDIPLDENAGILAAIRARFARRGFPMPEQNRRQAFVPRGAAVLVNAHGTAPGLWIEARDRVIVLLPGPPRELQPIFDTHAALRLEALTHGHKMRRRVLKITGRAESQVDEVAQPIYSPLASNPVSIQTTILAAPGQIELHLSARGTDVDALDRALESGVGRLAEALAPAVYSVDGRSLEAVVGDLLQAHGFTIAVAESCTAGLVLGRLTEIPGSSAWVVGGVVAYSNDVKTRQLGVPDALLAAHGAVSEPVAQAMAEGVRTRLGADIGLAITGIAGPGGGSEAKPVGTVVISATGAIDATKTFHFLGDRQMVRLQSVAAALDMVRRKTVEVDLRKH